MSRRAREPPSRGMPIQRDTPQRGETTSPVEDKKNQTSLVPLETRRGRMPSPSTESLPRVRLDRTPSRSRTVVVRVTKTSVSPPPLVSLPTRETRENSSQTLSSSSRNMSRGNENNENQETRVTLSSSRNVSRGNENNENQETRVSSRNMSRGNENRETKETSPPSLPSRSGREITRRERTPPALPKLETKETTESETSSRVVTSRSQRQPPTRTERQASLSPPSLPRPSTRNNVQVASKRAASTRRSNIPSRSNPAIHNMDSLLNDVFGSAAPRRRVLNSDAEEEPMERKTRAPRAPKVKKIQPVVRGLPYGETLPPSPRRFNRVSHSSEDENSSPVRLTSHSLYTGMFFSSPFFTNLFGNTSQASEEEENNMAQAKCLNCGTDFWSAQLKEVKEPHKPPLHCSDCNPSTEKLEYVYNRDLLYWEFEGYKDNCETCKCAILLKDEEQVKFCKKCNPSDSHNKYHYDNVAQKYRLSQVFKYHTASSVHRWASPDKGKRYDCVKCRLEKRHHKERMEYLETKRRIEQGTVISRGRVQEETFSRGRNNSVGRTLPSRGRDVNPPPDRTRQPVNNYPQRGGRDVSPPPDRTRYDENIRSSPSLQRGRNVESERNLEGEGPRPAIRILSKVKEEKVEVDILTTPAKAIEKYAQLHPDTAGIVMDFLGELDFSNSNLSGLNLRGANYSEMIFKNSKFINCDLTDVVFSATAISGCDFTLSILRGVTFTAADLHKSNFAGCDLTNAELENCNLEDAVLCHANLENALFQGSSLKHANLWETSLVKTNFKDSNMEDTDFTRIAKIRDIDFRKAKLSHSKMDKLNFNDMDFSNAEMVGCNMQSSKFLGTIFSGADLSKSRFNLSNLNEANLTEAKLIDTMIANILCEGTIFDGCSLLNLDKIENTDLSTARFNGASVLSWMRAKFNITV
jgi:uncharacterized protein YjbI with pentapeptide repeats